MTKTNTATKTTTTKTATKLTDKERAVLAGIYRSEYADGERPDVWTFSVRVDGMTAAGVKACLGSLKRKGMIVLDNDDEHGEHARVTDAGSAAYYSDALASVSVAQLEEAVAAEKAEAPTVLEPAVDAALAAHAAVNPAPRAKSQRGPWSSPFPLQVAWDMAKRDGADDAAALEAMRRLLASWPEENRRAGIKKALGHFNGISVGTPFHDGLKTLANEQPASAGRSVGTRRTDDTFSIFRRSRDSEFPMVTVPMSEVAKVGQRVKRIVLDAKQLQLLGLSGSGGVVLFVES